MVTAENALEDQRADFLIKARYNDRLNVKNIEYFLPEDGRLNYTYIDGNKGFDLTWGKITSITSIGYNNHWKNASYVVMATKDKRAHLDTQCALR